MKEYIRMHSGKNDEYPCVKKCHTQDYNLIVLFNRPRTGVVLINDQFEQEDRQILDGHYVGDMRSDWIESAFSPVNCTITYTSHDAEKSTEEVSESFDLACRPRVKAIKKELAEQSEKICILMEQIDVMELALAENEIGCRNQSDDTPAFGYSRS
jgi:hypothetical protein